MIILIHMFCKKDTIVTTLGLGRDINHYVCVHGQQGSQQQP